MFTSKLLIIFDNRQSFTLPISTFDVWNHPPTFAYYISNIKDIEFLRFIDYLEIDEDVYYRFEPTKAVITNKYNSEEYFISSGYLSLPKQFSPKQFKHLVKYVISFGSYSQEFLTPTLAYETAKKLIQLDTDGVCSVYGYTHYRDLVKIKERKDDL